MKKNSFINGALIATLGIVFTKFLGIVYVIPFNRIYSGDYNNGRALYGHAYTIYNLFLALSTVGIPPAISRLISEYNVLKYYYTKERAYKLGKRLLIGLGVMLFIIMFLGAPILAYLIKGNDKAGNTTESITFVIRAISTAILIVPCLSVTKGYLQGHKIMAPSSISQIIEQVVRIIVILLGSYLCMRIYKLDVTKSIGLSLTGATLGAFVAFSYLLIKIRKNKNVLKVNEKPKVEEKKITDKEIIKKILIYSLPFVSFGIALSVYDFIDEITLIKTLSKIGFNAKQAEDILAVITTTGNKLNSIVLAVSTGLITSLVPNIASSFAKKDYNEVKKRVNQSFLMILYITLPMAFGLSILAKPMFVIFSKDDFWGPKVFCLSIFVAVFRCVFTTSISIVQALNKFKNVFLSIIVGIIVKLILQIPLINLYNAIGIRPYWGATTATLIGLSVSFTTNILVIYKTINLDLKKLFKKMLSFIYPLIIMIIVLLYMKKAMSINNVKTVLDAIKILLIFVPVGALVYFSITIKNGIFNEIFGDKIFKKLKRNK